MKIGLNGRRKNSGMAMIYFILVMVLITAAGVIVVRHNMRAILPQDPPPNPPPQAPNNGANEAITYIGVFPYGFFWIEDRRIIQEPNMAPQLMFDDSLESNYSPGSVVVKDTVTPAPPAAPWTIGVYYDSSNVICLSITNGVPSGYTNTDLTGVGFTFDTNGSPVQNSSWTPIMGLDQVVRWTDSKQVNIWRSTNLVDWTVITAMATSGKTNYVPDYDAPPDRCFYKIGP
jgi:hypothetical protein